MSTPSMTTPQLLREDDTLSLSTTLQPDSKPMPGLCTYQLPSTPESNLPLKTKLAFAKGSVLSKLKLGEKSPAQLAEEELARKREAERVMRMQARQKNQEKGVWFRLGGEHDW